MSSPIPPEELSFDDWYNQNQEELYIKYHEQGANYDQSLTDFVEHGYELYIQNIVKE